MPGAKQIIKDLVPPIFIRWMRSGPVDQESINTQPIYPTFEAAVADCTNDSYEEKELVDVIVKKTAAFAAKIQKGTIDVWPSSAYSVLSMINPIINNLESRHIRVVDFGGAAGAHYFQVRHLIDESIKIDWVVVETSAMSTQSKELETEELKFTDSLDKALTMLETIDVVHTSGTFNFIDQPYDYLSKILSINANWLLLNRLCLNAMNRDVITIHRSMLSWHGVGPFPQGYTDKEVKTPFVLLSESKFLQMLEERYSISARFEDPSGVHAIEGEKAAGYGLLCKRKN